MTDDFRNPPHSHPHPSEPAITAEELLKAFGIIHGAPAEHALRGAIDRIRRQARDPLATSAQALIPVAFTQADLGADSSALPWSLGTRVAHASDGSCMACRSSDLASRPYAIKNGGAQPIISKPQRVIAFELGTFKVRLCDIHAIVLARDIERIYEGRAE